MMEIVNLSELAEGPPGRPVWAYASQDLNVNVLALEEGEGIAEHRNTVVDVLIVAIAGEGILTIDGAPVTVRGGQAVLIPKGARRSVRSSGQRFAYLTCHRRRPPLLPSGNDRNV